MRVEGSYRKLELLKLIPGRDITLESCCSGFFWSPIMGFEKVLNRVAIGGSFLQGFPQGLSETLIRDP